MTTYAKRLLVEGKYDSHVVRNLLRSNSFQIDNEATGQRHVSDAIALTAEDGIDPLLTILGNYMRRGELLHLGIVVDADQDVDSRWQQIKHRIQTVGEVEIPHYPSSTGVLMVVDRFTQPPLRLGIWLMPDNQNSGFLEHFVSEMIPEDDPLWPRVVNCVAQIPKDQQRFSTIHTRKAELHTWLAWQEAPGKPMGQALTFRYLDAQAPIAQRFVAWATQLFTP